MHASIRLRLTAWYVAALALTLGLLGGATFLFTRASLYHWLDEALAERAEALAEEVRLVRGQPPQNLPLPGRGRYEGVGDGFLILDGSRQVVLARGLESDRFGEAAAVTTGLHGWPDTSTVAVDQGHRWRVATHPILSRGRVASVVLVAHDLKELEEVLGRLALVMAALLPLALIGAGAGGFALASRALAPVDRITRAAAEISERD